MPKVAGQFLDRQRGGQAMETQIHPEMDRVGGDQQEGSLIASSLLNLQILPSHPPHHSFFSSSFSHSLQAHPIASAKRGSWAIWFDRTISLLLGRPLGLPWLHQISYPKLQIFHWHPSNNNPQTGRTYPLEGKVTPCSRCLEGSPWGLAHRSEVAESICLYPEQFLHVFPGTHLFLTFPHQG